MAATGLVNLSGPCDIEMRRTTCKKVHLFYASQNFVSHFIAVCEL